MNDREEVDTEESKREDRRNKQPATSKNPKGAGRPSREIERERDFEEFRGNPLKWFAERNPELFALFGDRGSKGSGEGVSERLNKRVTRGVVRRTLRFLGFKPKQIEKMNLDEVDEISADVWSQVMPHAIPKALTLPMKIAGLALWYLAEEKFTVTKKFSAEHWEAVPKPLKKQYYYLTEPDEEGAIFATRKRMQPQLMHTLVYVLQWLVNVITGIVKFFTGELFDLDGVADAQLERFNQDELYKLGIWRLADTQISDVEDIPEVYEERLETYITEMERTCLFNWWRSQDPMTNDAGIWRLIDSFSAEELERRLIESGCKRAEEEEDTFAIDPDYELDRETDVVFNPPDEPVTEDAPDRVI